MTPSPAPHPPKWPMITALASLGTLLTILATAVGLGYSWSAFMFQVGQRDLILTQNVTATRENSEAIKSAQVSINTMLVTLTRLTSDLDHQQTQSQEMRQQLNSIQQRIATPPPNRQ